MDVRYKRRTNYTSQCVKAAGLFLSLILSAWLLSIAVGTNSCPWLAWFALVPLFMAIRILRPPSASVAAAIWGACFYIFSISAGSSTIAPGPLPLILLVTIPAIYAFLGSLTTRRIGFNPLILALGWIAVEFALQPVGLHHGLLAGTQANGVLLDTVGRALGYVLVAVMVVSVNASLLALISDVRIKISPETLFSGLTKIGASVPSQNTLSLQLLALGQTYPRGPPHNRSTQSF